MNVSFIRYARSVNTRLAIGCFRLERGWRILYNNAVIHGKSISHQAVVGMGAVLSIWSEVGDEGAIVAEGAAVKLRQVLLPRTVAAGNPARTVRAVTAEDEAFWQWGKQRYLDLAKKYLSEGMQPIVP